MSSSFGTLFRVSTFGESHGVGVGAVVDGFPPNLELSEADIQMQLDRRRPGQSDLTTPRQEADLVRILSGVENGRTLGTPIGLLVRNRDQRPDDYGEMDAVPRPSHADYTYQVKYGVRASSGGGRSSARETIGRVAAENRRFSAHAEAGRRSRSRTLPPRAPRITSWCGGRRADRLTGLVWTGQACALGASGTASFDPGDPAPGTWLYFVWSGTTAPSRVRTARIRRGRRDRRRRDFPDAITRGRAEGAFRRRR